MPSLTVDYILGDALMHSHSSGEIVDLTTTLDPRYVNITGDTMGGNLIFPDNNSVLLGTGSDGELFHDGSNTYFQNNTGNIIIENDATDGDITFKVNDAGVDTTVMTLDGATGNVGIGTTSPGARLDYRDTTTATSGTNRLSYGYYTVNPSGAASSVNEGFNATVANTSNNNMSSYNSLVGMNLTVQNLGTGTVAGTAGVIGRSNNSANGAITLSIGGLFEPNNTSGGTVGTARGISSSVYNTGAGTTTTAYNIFAQSVANAGTISNSYGAFLANPTGAGTVTNNYGLYIENQTKGATLNYALYSAGGTNYFAGNVGIGTTAPTSLLSVGTASPFQVDTNGDIIKLKNLTYAWPAAHVTDGFLKDNGSGTLTWTTITGAGGVTGTGTDNYIPRWNGTTALENSIIFDDGTNVGIGTTVPSYKLSVQNTGGATLGLYTSAYGGVMTVTGGASDNSFYMYPASGITYYSTIGVDNIFALTNSIGSTTVTVTSNGSSFFNGGNVGIGTTSPTNILSVGGNSARTFWLERHTTANTAGNTLTITAGGATSGATDKTGGALILQGGLSTGSAESGVTIQGCVAGATGTTDRTQTTMIQVLGSKIGFYTQTPIARAVLATGASHTVDDVITALQNLGLVSQS